MADLTGTAGDDVLIGTSDNDTINGEAGNDALYGQDGDDVLVGGDGDDTLDGGNGSDTADYTTSSSAVFVNLGAGYEADDNGQDTLISIERVVGSDFSDQLVGGAGDDILEGGGDADLLRGRDGADILRGGAGNDYLQGGEGDDIIDGGAGTDRAAFYLSLPTDAQVGATVDLNLQGVAQDTGHGMDTLIDIENVSGTTLADTLTGDGNANWLWGQGGADVIDGQGGDDLVDLGAGDATASGGSGTDTLGFSSDLNLTSGVTVSLALQGAAQDTTIGSMTLSGFENLSGSYFDDTLTGDAGDNIIAGNDGSDVLAGGDGADTLYGDGRITVEGNAYSNDIALYQDSLDPADAGADSLSGGAGDDNLFGGSGDDTLDGGAGNDLLDGGDGFDTADYTSSASGIFVNMAAGYEEDGEGQDNLVSIERVVGSAFTDQMIGGSGADNFEGGDSDDLLRGRDGDDILRGGAGNDYLQGGEGNDILDGGAGTDRAAFYLNLPTDIQVGATVDLNLQGVAQDTGHGMDTLIGIENISGTVYADTLTGDGNANWLWGQGGADVIDGQGGDDLIELGAGDATASGGDGVDTVGFGNDLTITGGVTVSLALQGGAQDTGIGQMTLSNFENISGSAFNDVLTGDGGGNIIAGSSGDDTIDGGDGDDTLYGDGYFNVDGIGYSGDITLTTDDPGAVGNDVINGGAGNDNLYGGGGDDILSGGSGFDLLDGGDGFDTADYTASASGVFVNMGGAYAVNDDGQDTLVSIERVVGSTFTDQLFGGSGADNFEGGDSDDLLRGRDGDDILRGGAGADYLQGGEGNDIIDGGAGTDRAAFYLSLPTDAQVGATVDLNLQGVAQDTGHGMDTLIDIENVSGTTFADTLTGDGNANWLWGQGGADVIDGQGGDDLIELGAGDATASGGSGTDTLGFGNDATITGGVTVSLALQGGVQDTGLGQMTLSAFENLSGTVFDDVLTGDGGANIIAGSVGNDTIDGGDGDDTLYGDGYFSVDGIGYSGDITLTTDDPEVIGNDTLNGGAGNDSLYGGAGDDILSGGAGFDLLDGGDGFDTADYTSSASGIFVNLGAGYEEDGEGQDNLVSIERVVGSAFTDQMIGGSGADTLEGGDSDDLLRGRDGDDTLLGGAGNDYLQGGEGADVIDGGDGYDRAAFNLIPTDVQVGATVDLNLQGVAQDTGHGLDTLIGIEHVSGTALADALTGDGNANWLWGQGGEDVIDGQGGDDLITLGIGDATASGGSGTDTISYNEAYDLTYGVNVNLALQGGVQNTGQGLVTLDGFENASGSSFADTLTGDSGDNILAGQGGDDSLVGGDGNDTLYGDGYFSVDGVGYGGPITLFTDDAGVVGADILIGGNGDDSLFGGGGDDLLRGGAGFDALDGGDGFDTADYSDSTSGVVVNLAAGYAANDDSQDSLVSIEGVIGTLYTDILFGDDGDNSLDGGDSDDLLRGRDGADILVGGLGNDYLQGGEGDDVLNGGDGNDRAAFYLSLATDAQVGATVNLNLQGVAQDTGHGMDTLIGIEHVSGTTLADTLTGDANDNWLWGQGGADVIDGGAGDDLVELGAGDASASGGLGTDTLSFGNDLTLTGGVTVDLRDQGAAQDTGVGMMTLEGFENLSGSYFDDVLIGNGVGNVLAGNAGSDTLRGGNGDDVLYGDGYFGIDGVGYGGSITLFTDVDDPADAGNDTLIGGGGNDSLYGGGGDDILKGGTGDNYLDGGDGFDTASYAGSSGGVTVLLYANYAEGPDGVDTLISIEKVIGSSFNDVIFGDSGDNTLVGRDGSDVLVGNDGDDTLIGGADDDLLRGRNGNDVLKGGDGNDYLQGGEGDDILRGGEGSDRAAFYLSQPTDAQVGATVDLNLQGVAQDTGHGMDTLYDIENVSGTTFADTLTGDGNANWLWGQGGADVIDGQGGDDLIQLGAGDATASGGDGIDTLGFASDQTITTGVTVSLKKQGSSQNTGIGAMTLAGFENLSGSEFDDVLTGDDGDNILAGSVGDDVLSGGKGDDTLYGDGYFGVSGIGYSGDITLFDDDAEVIGADTLLGGAGDDALYGGAGADTLDGGNGDDLLDGGTGDDDMTGGKGDDTYVVDSAGDVIHESGSGGDDLVMASISYVLSSNLENLTLTGTADLNGTGSGDDNVITGNSGANILDGAAGDDTLIGGDGNDVLIGGDGEDALSGGAGADHFVFTGADVHLSSRAQTDSIFDLDFAAGDRIDLSAIDANIHMAGDQAFTFVNKFTRHEGQAVLSFKGGVTTLSLDVDGDGKAEFKIAINGHLDGSEPILTGASPPEDGGWVL